MKADGCLSRCPLIGTTKNAIFAVLCGYGRSIREIFTQLSAFWAFILSAIGQVIMVAIGNFAYGQRCSS